VRPDNGPLLMSSLTELDKAGSLCAQLLRKPGNSNEPVLLSLLESLWAVQTRLTELLISEQKTHPLGTATKRKSE
jgi:hypothetical protein